MDYKCKQCENYIPDDNEPNVDIPQEICDECLAKVHARLKYLRNEIVKERISYGEIAELQSLAKYIDKGDVLLLEWAGLPEYPQE